MGKSGRLKKYLCSIAVLIIGMMSVCADMPVYGEGNDEQKKKIKVACFLYDGYFEVQGDGSHYGYGFEYLDEIAEYTGFEYDYHFGTWAECVDMIENGEADLMPMLPRTEEREQELEFTKNVTNSTTLCLFAKDDSNYAYEDFESFDGMRVGVFDVGGGNVILQKYCENNEFSIKKVQFNDIDGAMKAMENNEIDAILTGDLKDIDGYVVIGNVGVQKFYMAASKGRSDITEQIDSALERIQLEEPDFEKNLNKKYFGHGRHYSPTFTKEEIEYIKNAEPVRVALYGTRDVLSVYDDETETFSGIFYDIMELLREKSGLKFEYSVMPLGIRGEDYFAQDKCDIIAPIMINEIINFSEKEQTMALGTSGRFTMIGRKNSVFSGQGRFRIVLSRSFFGTSDSIKKRYPNASITFVDTQSECYDKVAEGEADITFDSRLVALYKLCSPYYSEILTCYEAYDENEEFGMMLSYDADSTLVSILKKTIDSIPENMLNDIVVNNTASTTYQYSFSEIFYQFRYYIVAGVIAASIMMIMVISIFILRKKDKKYKAEKKRMEEKQEADEKYQKELYYQANYDNATGLLNRNGFYEAVRKILDENSDVQFVMLRGDIDQFKLFNDIMGVKMGDELIKHMASEWKKYFEGQFDACGYMGADDFICCSPYNSFDRDKMLNYFNGVLEQYINTYDFTMSVGAYIIGDPDIDVKMMRDRAELALALAKKERDIHFCLYDKSMREGMVKKQEIVNYIPTAFDREQFEVYLQPQYAGDTRKIIGAEALTRWNRPGHGMVSPGEFIPIMEENGMITMLDMYVVEHVCRILRELHDKNMVDDKFSIAVNLSRIDIFNNGIIDTITGTMAKYDIPVSWIRLEITESAYIEQNDKVYEFINRLKARNFVIEMDDFGSGYSSLNALKDVPVDTLKMDLRFLAGDNTDRGRTIIDSVIRMADRLGIPVIAEGVETEEQAEFLKSIGCHYMQGFFLARPMPVRDFVGLLG